VRTPLLAYHDPQFIDSDEGRPVRIVSEYLAPMRSFTQQGVSATVVFFGSARVRADGPLGHYLEAATELARLVAEWSRAACGARLVVCTGGGPGIMEAANRGAASTSACRTGRARTPTSRRACASSFITSSCASSGSPTWRMR